MALEVQETILGVHCQMQVRVAQRLPARQLDGDGQAVLLRGGDGVDPLALGFRHGSAHAQELPAVLHALVREDDVRQEEHADTQNDTGDDARVSGPELAPARRHSASTAITVAIAVDSRSDAHDDALPPLCTYRHEPDIELVSVGRWAASSLTFSVRSMRAKVRAIES